MPRALLIFGGRDFVDEVWMRWELADEHVEGPIDLVIHGGAAGADSLGGSVARAMGIPVEVYPADWKRHGKAGHIRNAQMAARLLELREVEIHVAGLAFPGGVGTDNMRSQLAKANIPCRAAKP